MTSKVKRRLTYLINSKKEFAVVSMHIINSQILLFRSIEALSVMGKKIVLNKGVYMDKELNSMIGTELKSQMLDSRNDIQRTNKLVNGTKISISLNELNNSDNLKDSRSSNTLFTYFVTSLEYFTHFKPQSPQYKKLKNDTKHFPNPGHNRPKQESPRSIMGRHATIL